MDSKNLTLIVDLTFSDNLNEQNKAELVDNVLNALVHEADTRGLAPDEAIAYTKEITVTNPETGITRKYIL